MVFVFVIKQCFSWLHKVYIRLYKGYIKPLSLCSVNSQRPCDVLDFLGKNFVSLFKVTNTFLWKYKACVGAS